MNLSFIKNPKFVIIVLVVLTLSVAGYLTYNYMQTKDELSGYKSSDSIEAMKEKEEIVKEIELIGDRRVKILGR